MQNRSYIYDFTYTELNQLLESWDQPTYRAQQIWSGLYHNLWNSPDEFTNVPKSLRNKLADHFVINSEHPSLSRLQPIRVQTSKDGETVKTLFSMSDGSQIEAVLMRYSKRRTLCISTQSGCAMGCVFCATGQMGYKRHLSNGEILEQVLYYARQLKSKNENVTNVVVMGMGEPFHNYDSTIAAIDKLNDPHGYNFGARRFTISTVGLIPGIQKFTESHTQINLAISLHAADNDLRSQLLPINKKYPLDDLLSTCLNYVKTTHRRITFEWALIQGVNDTIEQAHLLYTKLNMFNIGGSSLCHVNLIQLNPTSKYLGHSSPKENALEFQQTLLQSNIPCTIRLRRGIDIQASCGQLAIVSNQY